MQKQWQWSNVYIQIFWSWWWYLGFPAAQLLYNSTCINSNSTQGSLFAHKSLFQSISVIYNKTKKSKWVPMYGFDDIHSWYTNNYVVEQTKPKGIKTFLEDMHRFVVQGHYWHRAATDENCLAVGCRAESAQQSRSSFKHRHPIYEQESQIKVQVRVSMPNK